MLESFFGWKAGWRSSQGQGQGRGEQPALPMLVASRMCESDRVEGMCRRQPDLKGLSPRGLLLDGGAPSNKRLRGGVLGSIRGTHRRLNGEGTSTDRTV